MATNELSTASGDPGGTANLSNGYWFISIQTFSMGPGDYTVYGPNVLGDPHITTLDGAHYDFQGAGEFVLLKNQDAGFEVQSRMAPVSTVGPLPPNPHTGLSSCPSINTAAAIKSPKHRFSYQPAKRARGQLLQMQLRIDGKLSLLHSNSMALDDGTRVSLDRETRELRIALRDGWAVRIIPHWWAATSRWYLDYDFTPATTAAGIAGPIATRSWLPALSDGSSVGAMPVAIPDRYKALYEKFADSWRVSPATSLFDYYPGTSTATFTNSAWPGEGNNCRLPNTNPLAQVNEAQATGICAGVTPGFRDACIADVIGTGDRIFADGYIKTQGPKRSTVKYQEKYRGKYREGERGM